MRPSTSNAVLMTRPERDATGTPTGKTRIPAPWDVMTTQAVIDADPELNRFIHIPQYVDGVWAGNDPPAVYLRFTTEAEYNARIGNFLKRGAAI